jgi:hypothetical protein
MLDLPAALPFERTSTGGLTGITCQIRRLFSVAREFGNQSDSKFVKHSVDARLHRAVEMETPNNVFRIQTIANC